MNRLSLTRVAVVSATVSFVALAAACSTAPAPTPPATFCSEAKAGAATCAEPAACDATLVQGCASLDKALSPTTMRAAQDCLESGICSTTSCLTRAQRSAKPTDAHRALAESFCRQCAPDTTDCEAQFYAKEGRLPGVLVLPYSEAVAAAVAEDCTREAGKCRSTFASCANETIARVVGESLDAETAECVLGGLRRDDEGSAPSGGAITVTCTPANCNGCCRNNRCEEGGADSACGDGGAACQTCGQGQFCAAGQCKEPCGPNNCSGCCDGDACIVGTEKERCGSAGAACTSCTTQGASFICSNQTCIDGACSANCVNGCCGATGCQPGTAANACGSGGEACVDCGYGRTCGSAKACQLDRSSLWSVTVLSAIVPEKNRSGGSWEIFGDAPDPYVKAFSSLGASSHEGTTTVKDNTFAPVWIETPLTSIKADELLNNVSFEIWDSDFDFDDLIGGCAINVTPEQFDGLPRQVVCPPTSSNVSVTLRYRISKP